MLPKEKQPSNDLKAQAHIIADQKKIPEPEYRRLAKSVTGVDSMLKMRPDQAARFIRVLNTLPSHAHKERLRRYGITS